MKISRVETITIRHWWGPPEDGVTRDWLVVLVHTDDGLVGIGRGGNAGLINRELTPLLVGQDPRKTAMLWQRMYEAAWRSRGPGEAAMSSIGAIDVALWDIYGKSCGEPVWRLLGGYRDRVSAYADGIGYVEQPPERVASLVKKHYELGYKAVKFHLTSPDTDVALEKVRLSREAMGQDGKLMIDVHRMWHGRLAAEMARRLQPYNLFWIEEPVRHDDEPSYLRMVREATSALVAGGEGEGTLYGIRRLITEGGLQVAQADILGGGGFTGLMRIAALAEAFHVYVAPHGAQYPDINCHLVAAVPNGLMVPACPDVEPYEIWSKMYRPSFKVVDGHISMSEKPGLGLELDWDFIERYKVESK
jgi:D-galactarolactone cycloisomerase